MDINLKDKLKNLRQQKNVTQEALAKHLGISQQSVCKWERGEGFPDISLLPQIALYFNVSIDDLLDVGQARIKEKIDGYTEEDKLLGKIGDNNARIAVWENALKEFPNNHYVMSKLMSRIICKGLFPVPEDDAKICIELGTRILDESTDARIRESVISDMCYIYNSINDTEKALCYAEMLGSMFNCRESQKAFILDGEDGIKETQSCILKFVYLAALETVNVTNKEGISEEEKIRYIQFGTDLLKMLFSDGNYGGYSGDIAWRYSLIARTYGEMKDEEKTFEALEDCVKFSVLAAKTKEGHFTSPIIDRLEYGKDYSKNYKGNSCNIILKYLDWPMFDFIRDTQRFNDIREALTEYAEKEE